MDRSRIAALFVVALAVTAGCSGPLLGGDGAGRDPFGVPETTVPETTTRTTTETGGTTGTTRTVPTLTPAASSAFRAAVTNHSESLRTVGQFVVRERIRQFESVAGENTTSTANLTFAADLYADRYWFGIRNASEEGVYDSGLAYQDGTAVYHRRRLANGTVVYRRISDARERSVTPRRWALRWIRTIRNVSVMYPFERNGTVTVDGERMVRFTASGLPPFGCGSGTRPLTDLRNVTEARATALVDGLGLVRRFECVIAGQLYTDDRYRERVTRTLAEVGTATVRPPDRLVNETDPVPPGGSDDGG